MRAFDGKYRSTREHGFGALFLLLVITLGCVLAAIPAWASQGDPKAEDAATLDAKSCECTYTSKPDPDDQELAHGKGRGWSGSGSCETPIVAAVGSNIQVEETETIEELAPSPAATASQAVAEGAPSQAPRSSGIPSGFFASGELHGSLLTDAADRSLLSGTFGYGGKVGHRWSGWGAYLQMEQNLWISTELDGEVVQGAYNIGLGGELIYANGFVRTAAAAGPSILAFDTALDQAGSVGFFFDFHPLGLRWAMGDTLVLGLDPLSFAMVVPVLDGIPLLNVEYRSSFYMEGLF